jgi:hypothetical protein
MPVNKVRRLGSYAPLSAHYYKDDAVADAGEGAELLYVRGLAFCADVLSDGFISEIQLSRFVGVGMKSLQRRANRLVEVGLWSRVDGGYRVNGWLKWNRSRDDITDLNKKDAARKGSDPEIPDPEPPGNKSESERNPNGNESESESQSGVESERIPPSRAHSTPLHSTPRNSTPRNSNSNPASPKGSDFDRFYAAYPRKVGRKDAERKWAKAIKDGADPDTVITGAERYARQRAGQDQKFTKHPATWLHQGCWMDEDQTHLQLVSGGYQPFRNPTDQSVYEEDLL